MTNILKNNWFKFLVLVFLTIIVFQLQQLRDDISYIKRWGLDVEIKEDSGLLPKIPMPNL